MDARSFDAVAGALDLDERHEVWRARFEESSDSEPLDLPGGEALAARCAAVGIDDEGAAALSTARDALDDAAFARLLAHLRWVVRVQAREVSPYLLPWPALPRSLGEAGALAGPLALLAEVPHARARHRERGVPEDVSRATLADLGRQLSLYRELHGEWGFDEMPWMCHHFHGRLYELGRLQFALGWFWIPLRADVEPPVPSTTPILEVHIPATGPLDPASCDASFAAAPAFFARHVPEHPVAGFTCLSWLLADRLVELLPRHANILRFRRRFLVLPLADRWASSVRKFLFRRPEDTPASELPRANALQRAIADDLAAVDDLPSGYGWIPAPAPA